MENTLHLYDTLVQVLSQHRNWPDIWHLKTLAWMMVGLIQPQVISLSEWVPYVHSRAQYAQSTVRRFRRWLDNERIQVRKLYGPLIQQARHSHRIMGLGTGPCLRAVVQAKLTEPS